MVTTEGGARPPVRNHCERRAWARAGARAWEQQPTETDHTPRQGISFVSTHHFAIIGEYLVDVTTPQEQSDEGK